MAHIEIENEDESEQWFFIRQKNLTSTKNEKLALFSTPKDKYAEEISPDQTLEDGEN